ncbi:MAG: hypothetical protein NVSMB6_31040 [Burkholderiaceae bacterium]
MNLIFVSAFSVNGQATDRARLAAFVGMLSALNALCHPILESLHQFGAPVAALNLFGFSAVIAFAILTLERISASSGDHEELQPYDKPILCAVLLAAFLPVGQLSGVAGFALGGWLLVSSGPDCRCRRVGVVLLALSGPLLWGQLALSLYSEQLLSWDARLVGLLAHAPVQGNIVTFSGRHTAFFVGTPCSSLSHVTLATLLWASVTQLMGRRVDQKSLLLCGAAMASVIFLNILRLSAIATFPDQFTTIHEGWIAQVFGWGALAVAGGIVALGTMRATRT